jgi:hypothetical protein
MLSYEKSKAVMKNWFTQNSTRPEETTLNFSMKLSAKQASIMAVTATLYAVFFFLSGLVTVPNFTILYLPVILLGVFPVWFGLSGLAGSMIGAFIGGAFVEGLGFLGVFESVTTFIIYVIVWLLFPKNAGESNKKTDLALLLVVYAVSLFLGTGYILWQYTILPAIFNAESALTVLLPTYALNLAIEIALCPVLLRTLTPKMKAWGMYAGNFNEWRKRTTKQ